MGRVGGVVGGARYVASPVYTPIVPVLAIASVNGGVGISQYQQAVSIELIVSPNPITSVTIGGIAHTIASQSTGVDDVRTVTLQRVEALGSSGNKTVVVSDGTSVASATVAYTSTHEFALPAPGSYDTNSVLANQTFQVGSYMRVVSGFSHLAFKPPHTGWADAPLANDVNDYLQAEVGHEGVIELVFEALNPLGQTAQWVVSITVTNPAVSILEASLGTAGYTSVQASFKLNRDGRYRVAVLDADAAAPSVELVLDGHPDALWDSGLSSVVNADDVLEVNASGLAHSADFVVYIAAQTETGYTALVSLDAATLTVLPPVIALVGAATVTIEAGGDYTEQGATATDAQDGSLTGDIVISGSVDTDSPGSYTITYTVANSFDLTAQATRTVLVEDTSAPVITLTGPTLVTLEAGQAYVEPGYTAIDYISGNLTGSVVRSGAINNTVPGDYELIYSVSDTSGNVGYASRTVRVVDNTPPVLTLVGGPAISAGSGATFVDPGYTAIDIVDGDVSGLVLVEGEVDTDTLGTYTLTYTATDTRGNATSKARTVTVIDARFPVVTLLGLADMTIEAGSTFNEPGALASDAEDGDLTSEIIVSGAVNASVPGVYTRSYRVSDEAGNETVVARTVRVVDTTAPTITLQGSNPMTLEAGQAYVEPGYTALDIVDGNVTSGVIAEGSVNALVPGNYTRTYRVTDQAGNQRVVTRTVTVVDTTPPTLTLSGANPLYLEVGSVYTEPGAVANDIVSGDISAAVQVTGSVNGNAIGTYTLTYRSQDAAGNFVTVPRTVIVRDTTAPALTIIGDNPMVVPQGAAFIDPGAVAIDSHEGDLTSAIVVEGAVDVGILGDYEVTYTVQDSSGNVSTKTRLVQIIGSSSLTLEVGINSFATYSDLLAELNWNPQIRLLRSATLDNQKAAMAAAYFNILGMQPNKSLLDVEHFGDLTAEGIAELSVRIRKQLYRAQLIEADLLLGSNPVEDRRRMGMISDSNGESAQFFRTAIPLRLPVFRETALALTGLIVYTARMARG